MTFFKNKTFAQSTFILFGAFAMTTLQGCAGRPLVPTQSGAPTTLQTDSWAKRAEAKRVLAATERKRKRTPEDLLTFHCWYLDGRSVSTEFDMTTQSKGEAVDRFQNDLILNDQRILTVQAQALNDKRDLQLSLFLKNSQGAQAVIAFAGATAEVISGRLGAIGMTGAVDDPKTEIFQVDCRRPR